MRSLEMQNITKRFPGTLALNAVDFHIESGEIKALLGENGAGKSTLIKILSGAVHKDSGEILINEKPVAMSSPQDAINLGISVIHQEFSLVPALSIAENIFLGRLPKNSLFIQWNVLFDKAQAILRRLGSDLNVRRKVSTLSIANQQLVEIAKALSFEANILVMDEPTAALSRQETEALFSVIRRLKKDGVSIIYVSHRLEEVFEIADSVTILRDGIQVGDHPIGQVTPESLVRMMVGRELTTQSYHREKTLGPVRLQLRNCGFARELESINLEVRAGEIVGVTGLVGAGQTPLANCLFGSQRFDRGVVEIDGKLIQVKSPSQAIEAGIGLIPEDRRRQGLVLGLSIQNNVTLANLRTLSKFMFLNKAKEAEITTSMMSNLRIKANSGRQAVGKLSGGNQQKVVIAKWLAKRARVIIFHEPTRGIDVGAKDEIYKLIQELANDGATILLISSDMQEVLGVSDRLVVLGKGQILCELDSRKTDKEEVLMYATGGMRA